jgi:hypothetical protein
LALAVFIDKSHEKEAWLCLLRKQDKK